MSLRTRAAAALLALAASAALAVPAHADAESPPKPRGLFLTVSGAENTWIRGVLLWCAPEPGGPHPDAAGACRALAAAGGVLDKLPQDPHPCTKQYEPVTASATGTYQGRPVAWHRTFPNACTLDAATGAVFRF
ncbi:SSI family serine proteinase inhibitor [Streptomyces sp. NPDC001941]|uniref:SSI family serine proteinase inhibitor n=1 Tax=Streptomyces sp. NPDC001941 TaxID=3154659 RepID=UPI003324EF59